MNAKIAPSIQVFRNRFFVAYGKVRASRGFKTREAAEKELAENAWFHDFYANSASTSVLNSTPVVIHV